ncbi:hypothetical protein [Nonomuraea sp. KM90]
MHLLITKSKIKSSATRPAGRFARQRSGTMCAGAILIEQRYLAEPAADG